MKSTNAATNATVTATPTANATKIITRPATTMFHMVKIPFTARRICMAVFVCNPDANTHANRDWVRAGQTWRDENENKWK